MQESAACVDRDQHLSINAGRLILTVAVSKDPTRFTKVIVDYCLRSASTRYGSLQLAKIWLKSFLGNTRAVWATSH